MAPLSAARQLAAVPAQHDRILVSPWVPEPLQRLLRLWPVLLTGRFSGAAGTHAYRQAVQQVMLGAEHLAINGIDVRPFLPSAEDMIEQLRAAQPEISQADGLVFQHRHLLLDQARDQGLVVLVQCGTGVKWDDESLHQPASRHIAEQIMASPYALAATADFDRWGRGNVVGPIFTALRRHRTILGELPWVSGKSLTFAPADRLAENTAHAVCMGAAQEAESLQQRSKGAQRLQSRALVMRDGRVAYPRAYAPPPGLATARLKDPDSSMLGQNILFVDEPASRPADAEVAYGLSQVFDEQGQPVDQVETVRWFLRTYGTSDWDSARVAAALAQRKFSTESLRRIRRDASAVVSPSTTARNWSKTCNAILRHLDFYESGRLVGSIGDGGVPLTITGVFPRDGKPWLSQHDARRLRRQLEHTQSTRKRKVVHTFAGQPVLVDGAQGVLVPRTLADGSVVYHVQRPEARERLGGRAAPLLPLPHDAIAVGIAEAVQQAGQVPLVALTGEDSSAREQLEAEYAQVQQEIAGVEAAQAQRAKKLDIVTGKAAVRALEEAMEKGADTLTTLRARQLTLQVAVDQPQHGDRGMHLPRLFEFLASLADPTSQQFRVALRDCIVDFFQCKGRQQQPEGVLLTLDWGFDLLLHDPDLGTFRLPVRGRQQRHTATHTRRTAERMGEVVAALRAGVPLKTAIGARNHQIHLPKLRSSLGMEPGYAFMLTGIDDPRLLRLAMAVAHPEPRGVRAVPANGLPVLAGPPVARRDLRRLAVRLDEPVELLQRLHTLYVATGPGTPVPIPYEGTPRLAALYSKAARGGGAVIVDKQVRSRLASRLPADWDLSGARPVLRPCQQCGSFKRVLLRLREVDASVCRSCRRDRSGIVWPASYDRWKA